MIFPGKPSFQTPFFFSQCPDVRESPMSAWQRQKEPKVLAGLAISGAFLDAGLKCVQAGDLECFRYRWKGWSGLGMNIHELQLVWCFFI